MPLPARCDERWSLTWIVNHFSARGIGIKAGDLMTTGAAAAPKNQMLARLIPGQFKGNGDAVSANRYRRLLQLTDFVSGMTDSYAVSLYKKVTGISLPGG